MSKLAGRHPHTKFVKIISTDCIPELPDANLPTVLVYNENKCQKTFAGLSVWGGKRASEECVILTLLQCCILLAQSSSDSRSDAQEVTRSLCFATMSFRRHRFQCDISSDGVGTLG